MHLHHFYPQRIQGASCGSRRREQVLRARVQLGLAGVAHRAGGARRDIRAEPRDPSEQRVHAGAATQPRNCARRVGGRAQT